MQRQEQGRSHRVGPRFVHLAHQSFRACRFRATNFPPDQARPSATNMGSCDAQGEAEKPERSSVFVLGNDCSHQGSLRPVKLRAKLRVLRRPDTAAALLMLASNHELCQSRTTGSQLPHPLVQVPVPCFAGLSGKLPPSLHTRKIVGKGPRDMDICELPWLEVAFSPLFHSTKYAASYNSGVSKLTAIRHSPSTVKSSRHGATSRFSRLKPSTETRCQPAALFVACNLVALPSSEQREEKSHGLP